MKKRSVDYASLLNDIQDYIKNLGGNIDKITLGQMPALTYTLKDHTWFLLINPERDIFHLNMDDAPTAESYSDIDAHNIKEAIEERARDIMEEDTMFDVPEVYNVTPVGIIREYNRNILTSRNKSAYEIMNDLVPDSEIDF